MMLRSESIGLDNNKNAIEKIFHYLHKKEVMSMDDGPASSHTIDSKLLTAYLPVACDSEGWSIVHLFAVFHLNGLSTLTLLKRITSSPRTD